VNDKTKPLLRALRGETLSSPPFWLMRQAGRYLPEYRELRAKAGSFLDLCFTPDFAVEVTLQPLRRYGMDAAILFSDILVVPYALGQKLDYIEGEGPKLDPLRSAADLQRLREDNVLDRLSAVFETVKGVKNRLPDEAALIGFAGSPWTVAAYMVEGGGSKEFAHVKRWAFSDPAGFGALIEMLVDATCVYLGAQIDAGAEAVQLFDSWAGILPAEEFVRWVIEPTRRIVARIKTDHPETPIIGFPRGAGLMYRAYADESGVDALGLDSAVPLGWAARELQGRLPLQGNLDPVALVAGGAALERAAEAVLTALAGGPFVFNLGHGVMQTTPPEHVAQLARIIRAWRA
jgi:uroporphyrinogen decarboxylase